MLTIVTQELSEHMVTNHGWTRESVRNYRHSGTDMAAEHDRLHEDDTARHLDHSHSVQKTLAERDMELQQETWRNSMFVEGTSLI